ncbi:MAG: ABC transporter permease subunit [Chloroflexia bacterium]
MAQLLDRARRRLTILFILLLMVPITALWLTRFVMFTQVGLVDTLWSVVVPALMGTSPFFVLLYYWTFRRIPFAMFESARLDGAGVLRTWRSVAMPMAMPTNVAVGLLAPCCTGATLSTRCSTSRARASTPARRPSNVAATGPDELAAADGGCRRDDRAGDCGVPGSAAVAVAGRAPLRPGGPLSRRCGGGCSGGRAAEGHVEPLVVRSSSVCDDYREGVSNDR